MIHIRNEVEYIRAICINNKNSALHLTIGKEYECIVRNEDIIEIINDRGYYGTYYMSNFITIEEYRNKKLKELGI
jgi:hypothetical protein